MTTKSVFLALLGCLALMLTFPTYFVALGFWYVGFGAVLSIWFLLCTALRFLAACGALVIPSVGFGAVLWGAQMHEYAKRTWTLRGVFIAVLCSCAVLLFLEIYLFFYSGCRELYR